jgi:hypothetical protein
MGKTQVQKQAEILEGLHFGLSHLKHNSMELATWLNLPESEPNQVNLKIEKKLKKLDDSIRDVTYYIAKIESLLNR